jgi:hypothetical protein
MNEQFKAAVLAVKSLDKKTGGLWRALVQFICTDSEPVAKGEAKGTDMKPVFKAAEQTALAEMKVKMADNSTYRVQKNLICNCVKAGIALMDEKGQPRGKSELEAELDETKVPKTELEKFKLAVNTLTNIGKKLDASERLIATALVSDVLKDMTASMELKAAA